MASVRKRGNRFIFVADDPNQKWKTDENGDVMLHPKRGKKIRNQIYKSFDTMEEAELFQADFELKRLKGTVISPSTQKVADLVPRFIEVVAPLK